MHTRYGISSDFIYQTCVVLFQHQGTIFSDWADLLAFLLEIEIEPTYGKQWINEANKQWWHTRMYHILNEWTNEFICQLSSLIDHCSSMWKEPQSEHLKGNISALAKCKLKMWYANCFNAHYMQQQLNCMHWLTFFFIDNCQSFGCFD